jgi:hypothetical protein
MQPISFPNTPRWLSEKWGVKKEIDWKKTGKRMEKSGLKIPLLPLVGGDATRFSHWLKKMERVQTNLLY